MPNQTNKTQTPAIFNNQRIKADKLNVGFWAASLPVLALPAMMMFVGLELVVGFLLTLLPLNFYLAISLFQNRNTLRPSVALIVALCHTIFFTLGFFAYLLSGQKLQALSYVYVSLQDVNATLIQVGLISCAMIAGAMLTKASLEISPPSEEQIRVIRILGLCVAGAALLGAALLAISAGGFESASRQLLLHNKEVSLSLSQNIGGKLWSLFSLPALALNGLVLIAKTTSRRDRSVHISVFLVVSSVAIALFGSRLVIILGLVSCWFIYDRLRNVPINKLSVLIVSIGFVALSVFVLNTRAEAQNNVNTASLLENLSYGVFDITVGLADSDSELSESFASPERALLALSSVLPNNSETSLSISRARIDSIVAQYLLQQTRSSETTGLPPSLVTYLWVTFGPLGGLFAAFTLGFLMTSILNRFRKSSSTFSLVFIGLFGAFIFNSTKGGDLPLDIGSELSRWGYLFVPFFLITVLIRFRKGEIT